MLRRFEVRRVKADRIDEVGKEREQAMSKVILPTAGLVLPGQLPPAVRSKTISPNFECRFRGIPDRSIGKTSFWL
jgi:hypothetical protein